ncbi:hypothetical protein LCGC14_0527550 [marine sediment metagenome]|uniref:Uncharacterized protein n=1 Tax=marine sediment metagenome TaxID=412755 RepID=A0A0F9S1D3_9ZZZZ
MLTGQKKTDYQRDYMRRRRAGLTEPVLDLKPIVRPKTRAEAERMGKEVMGGHIPEIVLDPIPNETVQPTTIYGVPVVEDVRPNMVRRMEAYSAGGEVLETYITGLLKDVKPETNPKQEKLGALRKLIEQVTVESEPVTSQPIPRYNKRIHKQGDTVRMPGGEVVVVPELDGDNNPVPEI